MFVVPQGSNSPGLVHACLTNVTENADNVITSRYRRGLVARK